MSYDSPIRKQPQRSVSQTHWIVETSYKFSSYNAQLWQLCVIPKMWSLQFFIIHILISGLAVRLLFSSGTDFPLKNLKRTDTNLCTVPHSGDFSNQWLTLKWYCVFYSKACFWKQPHRIVILPSEPTFDITSQSNATHTDYTNKHPILIQSLQVCVLHLVTPIISGWYSLELTSLHAITHFCWSKSECCNRTERH